MESYVVLVFSLLFSFIASFSTLETIAPGQSINDTQTLVSPKGAFEAGFSSIGNLNNQYWGIWYRNISPTTFVWIANRETPIANSSGVLELTNWGNIVILDGTGAAVWSSNTSATSEKPQLQLLDSGNLVVIDRNDPNNLLWESFTYPTDTMLPRQKLKTNLVKGQFTSLTCWRGTDDPGRCEYSVYLDPHGLPQLVMTKNSELYAREGPWNGLLFSGAPWDRLSKFFIYTFVSTKEEVYYEYDILNDSIITRYVLSSSGLLQRFTWSDKQQSWNYFSGGPTDQCDYYDICGANSLCNNSNYPICICLEGFIPKNEEKWKSLNWSEGCVRRTNLSCDSGDGFLKRTGMQLPDTSSSWFDKNMNLEECKRFCLQNCSCTAYTNLDVRDGGSGCLLWFDNILDAKKHNSQGQDLYIRLAPSELDQIRNNRKSDKKKLVGIPVGIGTFIMAITVFGFVIYLRRKKGGKSARNTAIYQNDHNKRNEKEDIDLPSFAFPTIVNATNHFSFKNKLGEGGFGPVYKGALNGQEIAVKRLSKKSGQGPEEFKNEVVLIAKLQHRNLVKLIGYCIQNDERILIYEYTPNKSLDYFIFDQTRNKLLNWKKRFQIISGIARGLLYLHQDSRLRIIHRDLKTSNILLDDDMEPKISDFGMARTFGDDHAKANTLKVVGTHGYMSPEYVVHGSFSVKSDVFSFGVIVLEIISGRKNREFSDPFHNLNLLGHAWRRWSEGRPLELIDEALMDSVTVEVVIRCIHMGLLCVQERAEDRPDMSSVALMINGERPLPKPRQPGFYPHNEYSLTGKFELASSNEISISLLQAR